MGDENSKSNLKQVIVNLLTIHVEELVNFKETNEFKLTFGHLLHS